MRKPKKKLYDNEYILMSVYLFTEFKLRTNRTSNIEKRWYAMKSEGRHEFPIN